MNRYELYCNGYLLDTDAQINIPIFYQVSDLFNFGSRNQSLSYTVKLPYTSRNAVFFKNIINLQTVENQSIDIDAIQPNSNSLVQFDFNGLNQCRLLVEGTVIFDGYMIFRNTTSENRLHYINVQLIGDKTKWIQLLKDLYLNELNEEIRCIQYSEVSEFSDDLVCWYPVAYRDFRLDLSNGYVNIEDLRPHVFVKRLIYEMFNKIGYNVESDFIESKDFETLNILFANEKINWADGFESGDRLFYGEIPYNIDDGFFQVINASDGAVQNGLYFHTIRFGTNYNDISYVEFDPYNSWQPDSYTYSDTQFWEAQTWEAPDIFIEKSCVTGKKSIVNVDLKTKIRIIMTYNLPGAGSGTTVTSLTDSIGNIYGVTTNYNYDSGVPTYSFDTEVKLLVVKGDFFSGDGDALGEVVAERNYTFSASGTSNVEISDQNINDQFTFEAEPGSTYFFVWLCNKFDFTGSVILVQNTLLIDTTSLEISFESTDNEGRQLDIYQNLPTNWTCFDLFHNIAKMFNLYVRTDENTKTCYIETRDNYLNQLPIVRDDQFLDWTAKTDISQVITQQFTNRELPYLINFIYKPDSKDFYLELYAKQNEFPLGNLQITNTDNTKNTNSNIVSVDFSATESLLFTEFYDVIFPALLPDDINLVNSQNTGNETKGFNFRIAKFKFIESDVKDLGILHDFGNTITNLGGYPKGYYSLEISEDGYEEDYTSLRFDDITGNDGLFTKYYQNQYNLVLNSREIVQQMYLSPADIFDFNFSKIIKIGNILFYCQAIENYNPNTKRPCTVRLIKIV